MGRQWHFLGVQCNFCSSFNTNIDKITMTGQDAVNFLGIDEEEVQRARNSFAAIMESSPDDHYDDGDDNHEEDYNDDDNHEEDYNDDDRNAVQYNLRQFINNNTSTSSSASSMASNDHNSNQE